MFTFALCFIFCMVIGMANVEAQTLPTAGHKAPDFSLLDQHGNTHSLEIHKGKFIVVYFYPKDDTPGCTKEACGFRDDFSSLTEAGAVVLGVSTDDVESHKQFAEKFHLNFSLLADVKKEMTHSYGVLSESGTAKRVTFLLDEAGIVVKVYPAVNPVGHSQEILADIQAAKLK